MANEGNQWWRKRSSHGRGLLFSSPDLLWNAACEYFEWTDNRTDITKKETSWFQGEFCEQDIICKVPYTWEGMTLFFGCSLSYFRSRKSDWKKQLREGTADEMVEDFLAVMELIDRTIFTQQYNHTHAGNFKEGLTTRYLRLQETTQLSTSNPDESETGEKKENEFKITLKLD